MDLETLYFEVKETIDRLKFDDLWRGFSPVKFALYDAKRCIYDRNEIPKPKDFVANTSVWYEGEQIAIWHVMEPMDVVTLTTKIIHEMFHAYQTSQGESRFPKEMEALSRYQYDEGNLSLKYEENQLLVDMAIRFTPERYRAFKAKRFHRRKHYPYEFHYEASIEEIEGAAQYVELRALELLDQELYRKRVTSLKQRIQDVEKIVPIRVRCYDVGAMLFQVLKKNNLLDFENLVDVLTAERMLDADDERPLTMEVNPIIATALEEYRSETKEMIHHGLTHGTLIDQGELELLGVNIYDARFLEGDIISTYFVWYEKDGQEQMRSGDFLIHTDRENHSIKIYQMPQRIET